MRKDDSYIGLMNQSILQLFKDALRITDKNPAYLWYILKTIRWQKQAIDRRKNWQQVGIHVPPFMITSITNRCNLKCKGCYARAQHRSDESEMSEVKLRSILKEARELGISLVLLAGGEPLVRTEILEIIRDFPKIIFPLFTNGLLINEEVINKLSRQKNVIPVISLEGFESDTDDRRGKGVYEYLHKMIPKMSSKNIFYGISLTTTRLNFETITDKKFIQSIIDLGCKLFFFVEYVPVREGTEDWTLTEEQRVAMKKLMDSFRSKYPSLFIAFPGDEEEYGGCLASGRGFVHISPAGNVEPCPFAPYSVNNLKDISLKDALQSEFLDEIRKNHDKLSEHEGGCALWENREWVSSLLHNFQPKKDEDNLKA